MHSLTSANAHSTEGFTAVALRGNLCCAFNGCTKQKATQRAKLSACCEELCKPIAACETQVRRDAAQVQHRRGRQLCGQARKPSHHVDVLPPVPRPPGQPRVEAERRERAEDVLIERLVIALDVVGHLRGRVAMVGPPLMVLVGVLLSLSLPSAWEVRRRLCSILASQTNRLLTGLNVSNAVVFNSHHVAKDRRVQTIQCLVADHFVHTPHGVATYLSHAFYNWQVKSSYMCDI